MAKKRRAPKIVDGRKIVATNRKARHDYDVLDRWECGMVLVGSEVKSLRDGQVQIKDAYAEVRNSGSRTFTSLRTSSLGPVVMIPSGAASCWLTDARSSGWPPRSLNKA